MTLDLNGKFVHMKDEGFLGRRGRKVLAVTGACCLMWRKDFAAVGGFDTGYVNGGEDVDLCFRLGERGLSTWVSGCSRVGHHVGLSRGAEVSMQAEENSYRLYRSWREKIIDQLAGVWARALLKDPREAFQAVYGGHLADSMFRFPHSAAALFAEHRVNLEVSRWKSIFTHGRKDVVVCRRFSGGKLVPGVGLEISGSARMDLEGGGCPRNLVFHGNIHVAENSLPFPVGISIDVNGVIRNDFFQVSGGFFELEIVEPIWWTDAPNVIRVELEGGNESSAVCVFFSAIHVGEVEAEIKVN
jgi:hypothetical protein